MIALFVMPILLASLTGVAFSHWSDRIYVVGQITTWSGGGGGTGACIEIQKTLYGSFTDPKTGINYYNTTNLIRIGSNSGTQSVGEIGCPPTNFPTKFKMCINVTNCGPTDLTNVVVTDRLENQFTNSGCANKSDSTDKVSWVYITNPSGFEKSYLTWEIGNLTSGESASLCFWITTTQNPVGFYEPTSANQNYLVNLGAKVEAVSPVGNLTAQTDGIVLEIGGFVLPNIAEILTSLPFSTPWASDHIES
jgi:hypothetical protein